MATHFDEKSGIVKSATPWGHWYQTIDEVVVIVNLERGTRAKQLKVDIKPQRLKVVLLNSPNTAPDTPQQVLIDMLKRPFKKSSVQMGTWGVLRHPILADEALWTIENPWAHGIASRLKDVAHFYPYTEDAEQLRIVLTKCTRTADGTWDSLLEGQYHVNIADLDSMEKKMTLERFARENPGFDFSGAEISGNYKNGVLSDPTMRSIAVVYKRGPDLPAS